MLTCIASAHSQDLLVTQAHRNNTNYYFLGKLSRVARTLNGGGGLSTHVTVAMGSWVVYSSHRHMLGGGGGGSPP